MASEVEHHAHFVAFVEFGALAAFGPDDGGKGIAVNGGEAQRREEFRGQREGEHASGADGAGVFDEIAHEDAAEAGTMQIRMDRHGADFREVFPQNVEAAAGDDGFDAVDRHGDDAIVLYVLVQVERPPGKHDAGGGKFIDEAGHAVHILDTGLSRGEHGRQNGTAQVGQGILAAEMRRLRSCSKRLHGSPF
mgnify:CR=1 FL=1